MSFQGLCGKVSHFQRPPQSQPQEHDAQPEHIETFGETNSITSWMPIQNIILIRSLDAGCWRWSSFHHLGRTRTRKEGVSKGMGICSTCPSSLVLKMTLLDLTDLCT